jgi:hypothetical protein
MAADVYINIVAEIFNRWKANVAAIQLYDVSSKYLYLEEYGHTLGLMGSPYQRVALQLPAEYSCVPPTIGVNYRFADATPSRHSQKSTNLQFAALPR